VAEIVSLDEGYATTRLCHRLIPEEYLNGEGKVDPEKKFAIDIPEYGIKASRVPAKSDEKFDTLLFQPEGDGQWGEGGLRTGGYFKHSYKKVDDQWYIVDQDDNPIEVIDDKKVDSILDMQQLSSKSLPLITIITVVYNGEKYLEETIKSVLAQNYPNIEYLVIDGGSTDGTLDILRRYDDYIDYWVSEKDKGIYDAINKGLTLARGSLVGIIGADDIYYKEAVMSVIACAKNSKKELLYGGVDYIDAYGVVERSPRIQKPEDENFMVRGMSIPHIASFLSMSVYKRYGLYNTVYRYASDYDYYMKIYRDGISIGYIEKQLTKFRNTGATNTQVVLSNIEAFKIRKFYGVPLWFNCYITMRTIASKYILKTFRLIVRRRD